MSCMQWTRLLNDQRLGKLFQEQSEMARTPFHKDYDRLIFSSAFRRLGHKTQVHSLSHNDHVHNRLTHSLEVSSVGRSLGTKVAQALLSQHGWPAHVQAHDVGAIVQSACLAHDIGNPPFGHFGESAIRRWFDEYAQSGHLSGLSADQLQDFVYFEGNAQGLRTLTQLEYHQNAGGMRLTYATLGSFIKYPWRSDHARTRTKGKYGAMQSEADILAQIASILGLLELEHGRWCRHPLAYLMEAADDICYAIVDLEDGVELGLLDEMEVLELLAPITGPLAMPERLLSTDGYFSTRRLALLRGKVIDHLVDACAQAFVEQEDALLRGTLEGDLIDYADPPSQSVIHNAKCVARQRIFSTHQRYRTELGASAVLEKILSGFVPAAIAASGGGDSDGLRASQSTRFERYLSLMGAHRPESGCSVYEALCHTMDYVGGMTDKYAVNLAQQLNGELWQ